MTRDAATSAVVWVPLLGGDPLPWLLASDEPAARWVTLTGVLDRPGDDPEVLATRAAVVADPATQGLLGRLPDWEADNRLSGHDSPRFASNLLNLLADMGLQEGDDPRVERLLEQLLAHQEPSGRFPSLAASRAGAAPVWGALLCDSHAVLEVLVRYGRGDDPRVQAGLAQMAADQAPTAQGRAWPCLPHPVTGFRGPGRKGDVCPQVTLEALRTFARLPQHQRPDGLLEVARVALRAWRTRSTEQPYMFGHGRRFKTVKWPVTWYGAYSMLDPLGRYPALWRGRHADPGDRTALAELAACLVAYNAGRDGTVTPRSVWRGFETYSFGQKRRPSPFATAQLLAVLHRLDDLATVAAAVDVLTLGSSKGGSGTAIPPRPPVTAGRTATCSA